LGQPDRIFVIEILGKMVHMVAIAMEPLRSLSNLQPVSGSLNVGKAISTASSDDSIDDSGKHPVLETD
jgi:hypothetical protein